jgi:hypothetical protein
MIVNPLAKYDMLYVLSLIVACLMLTGLPYWLYLAAVWAFPGGGVYIYLATRAFVREALTAEPAE